MASERSTPVGRANAIFPRGRPRDGSGATMNSRDRASARPCGYASGDNRTLTNSAPRTTISRCPRRRLGFGPARGKVSDVVDRFRAVDASRPLAADLDRGFVQEPHRSEDARPLIRPAATSRASSRRWRSRRARTIGAQGSLRATTIAEVAAHRAASHRSVPPVAPATCRCPRPSWSPLRDMGDRTGVSVHYAYGLSTVRRIGRSGAESRPSARHVGSPAGIPSLSCSSD